MANVKKVVKKRRERKNIEKGDQNDEFLGI